MALTLNGSADESPLRRLRTAAGVSQEKLARQADCSTNLVRLVEHGYRPSDEMLDRIAAALGCNASELAP
jgi:transcriptional regulator with XRE-family HTH domain